MALFATTTDLEARFKTAQLADLFSDATPKAWDSTSQATAELYLDSASLSVQRVVRGHIDTTDADVQTELKSYCITYALIERYRDRGTNPGASLWNAYREARKNLDRIQTGELKLTDNEVKSRLGWSSTEDNDPEYAKAATGGDGDDSDLLEGF